MDLGVTGRDALGGLLRASSGPHLCCRTLLTVAGVSSVGSVEAEGNQKILSRAGMGSSLAFYDIQSLVSTIPQNYGVARPLTAPQSVCLVPIHLGYAVGPLNVPAPLEF